MHNISPDVNSIIYNYNKNTVSSDPVHILNFVHFTSVLEFLVNIHNLC